MLTSHYHPFSVYNLTIPENATYEILYKLLNDYQMEIVENMTQWIEMDASITRINPQTQRPEISTRTPTDDAKMSSMQYCL